MLRSWVTSKAGIRDFTRGTRGPTSRQHRPFGPPIRGRLGPPPPASPSRSGVGTAGPPASASRSSGWAASPGGPMDPGRLPGAVPGRRARGRRGWAPVRPPAEARGHRGGPRPARAGLAMSGVGCEVRVPAPVQGTAPRPRRDVRGVRGPPQGLQLPHPGVPIGAGPRQRLTRPHARVRLLSYRALGAEPGRRLITQAINFPDKAEIGVGTSCRLGMTSGSRLSRPIMEPPSGRPFRIDGTPRRLRPLGGLDVIEKPGSSP